MLNVALAYNVKPDEASFEENIKSQQSTTSSIDYDDIYAEWDTYETIYAIRDAIALNHNVTLIEADNNAFEKLKSIRPDIVFNVAEGAFGISRESQIPSMLDMLQIPYTGSDPLTLACCLHKGRTKEILKYHHIPTADFEVVKNIDDIKKFSLNFPVIIKPLQEGSSKGIFDNAYSESIDELLITSEKLFYKYKQPLIIEEFLPGREFTAAIIGNGNKCELLPIIEIKFDEFPDELNHIYSYEAKWIYDTRDKPLNIYSCPADINAALEKSISETVLKTFEVLECKDWSRIDIRLDHRGIPNIIEVNPLPGVLPDPDYNSCFPKAARTAGIDYNTMINKVLDSAISRYGIYEKKQKNSNLF